MIRKINSLIFLEANRISISMNNIFWRFSNGFTIFWVCVILAGCTQNNSKTINHSICLFLGYDSVYFYENSSDSVTGAFKGKISDSVFINKMISSVKSHSADSSYNVIFRISAGLDIVPNVEDVVALFNKNNLHYYYDSVYNKDITVFNAKTFPEVISPPIILAVPKEVSGSVENATITPCLLTLIIVKTNEIYAYEGTKLSSGIKLRFPEVDTFLANEQKKFLKQDFTVAIRPSENSTYNDYMSMTEKMKNGQKYFLQDLTKEEMKYLGIK